MKDQSIRRMGRAELLELLIQYTDEKEALQAQLDQTKAELDEARRQLAQQADAARQGRCEEAGQISGRLEEVHALALQCLEEIRAMQAVGSEIPLERQVDLSGNESAEQGQMKRRRRGTGL